MKFLFEERHIVMKYNLDSKISLVISELERAKRTNLGNSIPIKDINTGSYIYEIYAICYPTDIGFSVKKLKTNKEVVGIINNITVTHYGVTYKNVSYKNNVRINLPDSVLKVLLEFKREFENRIQ